MQLFVNSKLIIVVICFIHFLLLIIGNNVYILTSFLVWLTLLFSNRPFLKWKIFGIFYFYILAMLVTTEIIKFPLMPQAAAIYNRDEGLVYALLSSHPHSIRLLVSSPGIIIANTFGISLDYGCSLYSVFIFYLIYYIGGLTVELFQSKFNAFNYPIIAMLMPLFFLPIIMHGRLIYAFLGILISINSLQSIIINKRITLYYLLKNCLGLIFCCVSTGVLFVFLLSNLWIILTIIRKYIFNNKIYNIIYICILCIVVPYVIKMIKKLFEFFGDNVIDGIIGILNHGAGKYFLKYPYITIFSIAILFPVFVFLIRKLNSERVKNNRYFVLIVFVVAALACIPCGMSAGMMFIVPLITITACYLERIGFGRKF